MYTNIHNVHKVEAERHELPSCNTLYLKFYNSTGDKVYEITLFSHDLSTHVQLIDETGIH